MSALDEAFNNLLLMVPKLQDRSAPSFSADTKLKDATVAAIKELTLALYDDSRVYQIDREANVVLNNFLTPLRW